MAEAVQPRKVLSLMSIMLITVGAFDSIRNLPTTALFGASLIAFFLIAAVTFLLPATLVAAELSTGWPRAGGVYNWVKEAFGEKYGLLAIWFQWAENIIWYPTILSSIAGSIAYIISPSLADNKLYLVSVILVMFWSVSYINMRGLRASALFSNTCCVIGLITPMLALTLAGIVWLLLGKPIQVHFSTHELIPDFRDPNLLVSITGVILCYCGAEITGTHALEVRNPQRDYPRALIWAVVVILLISVFSALAIAMAIPHKDINLVSGVMQAFTHYFNYYHIAWLIPFMALFIAIGGLGGLSDWIYAPSKGLMIALRDIDIPVLKEANKQGAPGPLLWLQAVMVSLITLAFIFMPSVSSAYWLLTVLSSQLYMIMYILMFAAAIWMRYKHPDVFRAYRIPGAYNLGMWFVAGVGTIASIAVIIIGFFPPADMHIHSVAIYETMVVTGFVLLSAPPFFIYQWAQMRRRRTRGDAGNVGEPVLVGE